MNWSIINGKGWVVCRKRALPASVLIYKMYMRRRTAVVPSVGGWSIQQKLSSIIQSSTMSVCLSVCLSEA